MDTQTRSGLSNYQSGPQAIREWASGLDQTRCDEIAKTVADVFSWYSQRRSPTALTKRVKALSHRGREQYRRLFSALEYQDWMDSQTSLLIYDLFWSLDPDLKKYLVQKMRPLEGQRFLELVCTHNPRIGPGERLGLDGKVCAAFLLGDYAGTLKVLKPQDYPRLLTYYAAERTRIADPWPILFPLATMMDLGKENWSDLHRSVSLDPEKRLRLMYKRGITYRPGQIEFSPLNPHQKFYLAAIMARSGAYKDLVSVAPELLKLNPPSEAQILVLEVYEALWSKKESRELAKQLPYTDAINGVLAAGYLSREDYVLAGERLSRLPLDQACNLLMGSGEFVPFLHSKATLSQGLFHRCFFKHIASADPKDWIGIYELRFKEASDRDKVFIGADPSWLEKGFRACAKQAPLERLIKIHQRYRRYMAGRLDDDMMRAAVSRAKGPLQLVATYEYNERASMVLRILPRLTKVSGEPFLKWILGQPNPPLHRAFSAAIRLKSRVAVEFALRIGEHDCLVRALPYAPVKCLAKLYRLGSGTALGKLAWQEYSPEAKLFYAGILADSKNSTVTLAAVAKALVATPPSHAATSEIIKKIAVRLEQSKKKKDRKLALKLPGAKTWIRDDFKSSLAQSDYSTAQRLIQKLGLAKAYPHVLAHARRGGFRKGLFERYFKTSSVSWNNRLALFQAISETDNRELVLPSLLSNTPAMHYDTVFNGLSQAAVNRAVYQTAQSNPSGPALDYFLKTYENLYRALPLLNAKKSYPTAITNHLKRAAVESKTKILKAVEAYIDPTRLPDEAHGYFAAILLRSTNFNASKVNACSKAIAVVAGKKLTLSSDTLIFLLDRQFARSTVLARAGIIELCGYGDNQDVITEKLHTQILKKYGSVEAVKAFVNAPDGDSPHDLNRADWSQTFLYRCCQALIYRCPDKIDRFLDTLNAGATGKRILTDQSRHELLCTYIRVLVEKADLQNQKSPLLYKQLQESAQYRTGTTVNQRLEYSAIAFSILRARGAARTHLWAQMNEMVLGTDAKEADRAIILRHLEEKDADLLWIVHDELARIVDCKPPALMFSSTSDLAGYLSAACYALFVSNQQMTIFPGKPDQFMQMYRWSRRHPEIRMQLLQSDPKDLDIINILHSTTAVLATSLAPSVEKTTYSHMWELYKEITTKPYCGSPWLGLNFISAMFDKFHDDAKRLEELVSWSVGKNCLARDELISICTLPGVQLQIGRKFTRALNCCAKAGQWEARERLIDLIIKRCEKTLVQTVMREHWKWVLEQKNRENLVRNSVEALAIHQPHLDSRIFATKMLFLYPYVQNPDLFPKKGAEIFRKTLALALAYRVQGNLKAGNEKAVAAVIQQCIGLKPIATSLVGHLHEKNLVGPLASKLPPKLCAQLYLVIGERNIADELRSFWQHLSPEVAIPVMRSIQATAPISKMHEVEWRFALAIFRNQIDRQSLESRLTTPELKRIAQALKVCDQLVDHSAKDLPRGMSPITWTIWKVMITDRERPLLLSLLVAKQNLLIAAYGKTTDSKVRKSLDETTFLLILTLLNSQDTRGPEQALKWRFRYSAHLPYCAEAYMLRLVDQRLVEKFRDRAAVVKRLVADSKLPLIRNESGELVSAYNQEQRKILLDKLKS